MFVRAAFVACLAVALSYPVAAQDADIRKRLDDVENRIKIPLPSATRPLPLEGSEAGAAERRALDQATDNLDRREFLNRLEERSFQDGR